jgi:hypothetical protein
MNVNQRALPQARGGQGNSGRQRCRVALCRRRVLRELFAN